MRNKLTGMQKDTLNILLEKYEASKTYIGGNKRKQSFKIKPTQVFSEYDSDYTDIDTVRDFENQMDELKNIGLITIARNHGQISKIVATEFMWESYYKLLGKVEKNIIINETEELYKSYLGIHKILEKFCEEQLSRISDNKKPSYNLKEGKIILDLIKSVINNERDILERELSIANLGDSKLWEAKYRSNVCIILRQYGDFENQLMGIDEKRDIERIILEEYNIFSNPSYVYFKGNASIYFKEGKEFKISLNTPIAIPIETIEEIENIKISDSKVITIENLTSFNRVSKKDEFYIFISGYHNLSKQKFIKKVYNDNNSLEWYHFGDIDPDGFLIIEHLKRGTGIGFKPLYMGREYLERYSGYTKEINSTDISKAKRLIEEGNYVDVMSYILDSGVKLEQEIISWMDDLS